MIVLNIVIIIIFKENIIKQS